MGEEEGRRRVDPRSGYCESNGIYYSKRDGALLPCEDEDMDIATFVFKENHHHHDGTVLIDAPTGAKLSYRHLRQNVNALAAGLHGLGIRKGDVVLVVSPNSIMVPCIYLGVLSIGAIVTTANPLSTGVEMQRQIEDSKPVLVFTLPHLVSKVSKLPTILIQSDDQNHPSCVSTVDHLLGHYAHATPPSVNIKQHDTATLLYSSGTTGKSKGVISSHRNYIAIIAQYQSRKHPVTGPSNNVSFCTMPMFHVYGFFFILSLIAAGTTTVVMARFDLDKMLWAVERYRVNLLPTTPPILVALAKSSVAAKYDLSSLQRIGSGGAPLRKEVIQEFAARFPTIEIAQGYGMTETGGAGSHTEDNEEIKRYGTAGLLSANMEAKVVDPVSGKPLPPNRTGELWLRGPTIMKGYFGNEAATASAIDSEGWLKTGDLCYIDDEGFLFVVDRLKELIKYKSFQVAPAELEELLLSHSEISDAAVIPYPDNEAGQIPMAYVVRKPGSKLSEEDVMNFVAKQVSPYKKIRRVAFVTSIPKSPSGKILRKDLIQQASPSSRM